MKLGRAPTGTQSNNKHKCTRGGDNGTDNIVLPTRLEEASGHRYTTESSTNDYRRL